MSIYDFSLENKDGSEYSLAQNKGKVMMIVNTATRCGFTHQYEEIEALYDKYRDKGFEIIDIPCNQFGEQAPESDEEITQFCSLNFGTKFPQMKKSEVNGENELPLYTFLKQQVKPKYDMKMKMIGKMSKTAVADEDIKWNFTKFIVDREGNVVARFEPTNKMADLDKLIEKLVG